MAKKKPTPPESTPTKVTWAQAARDLGVHAMNKGLVLPATLAALVIIIGLRLPSDDLLSLLREIMAVITSAELVGWSLAVVALFGWALNVRYLDRKYKAENQRLGAENSRLHDEAAQHFEQTRSIGRSRP